MLTDQDIDNDVAAFRAEEHAIKEAIHEKAKLYFSVAFLAVISYVLAALGPSWLRWIAGFFMSALVLGQFGMLSLIRKVQLFYSPYRYDIVARNHLLMGIVALLALVYALLAFWWHWPVPWLAMIVGIFINVIHGIGYAPSGKHG